MTQVLGGVLTIRFRPKSCRPNPMSIPMLTPHFLRPILQSSPRDSTETNTCHHSTTQDERSQSVSSGLGVGRALTNEVRYRFIGF